MFPLFHQGSVKDILGRQGESPYIFRYSDRYSVFDWGAMPDQLEDKGKALAFMADFFFKQMQSPESWQKAELSPLAKEMEVYRELTVKGLAHHSLGLCDEQGHSLNHSREWGAFLKVEPVQIVRPEFRGGEYHYEKYRDRPLKALVPLEVIFRFGVPQGSSLLKRVGDLSYCRSLGLDKAPQEGDRFENPIIEFSTKLESTDRYIDESRACEVAALTNGELKRLKESVLILALRLKELFAQSDIDLWDGKFEFAFAPQLRSDGERDFWVVDSIGPDELRLSYRGVQLSKENLRQFYRGCSWHLAIEEAKKMAKERGSDNWKSICLEELNCEPSPLKSDVKEAVEMMYRALANALSQAVGGERVFPSAWELEQVVAHWS